jgi:hypothetical protein
MYYIIYIYIVSYIMHGIIPMSGASYYIDLPGLVGVGLGVSDS